MKIRSPASLNASLAQVADRRRPGSRRPTCASQGTALGAGPGGFISSATAETIWVGGGSVSCVRGQVALV